MNKEITPADLLRFHLLHAEVSLDPEDGPPSPSDVADARKSIAKSIEQLPHLERRSQPSKELNDVG